VLIRQCTLDIFALINATDSSVGKFLITGTSGVGKSVSMIVWLYFTLTNIWKTPVKAIIVDLPTDCCFLLRQTDPGTWVEGRYDRRLFLVHDVGTPIDVLYLYDAVDDERPLVLPCRSVVFTAPNRDHSRSLL
jgi:hypothetical protein